MAWTTAPVELAPGLRFDVASIKAANPRGEAVIALHGFPQGARSYEAVGTILASSGYDVYAPEQRGYSPGARPTAVDAYTDRVLASDVIGLLDALGLDQVHLVGHDWGAHVAWVVAATYPDRIASLTAVSVPHPTAFARAFRESEDQRERSAYIKLFWQAGKAEEVLLADNAQRLRAMLHGIDPEMIDFYAARMQAPGALTAALNWYRAMGKGEPVPTVAVPTTYVWSDQDIALGADGARMCAEYVDADYRFVTLPGVSHWIPEQAAEALAEQVLARAGS